jgi:hypothetical protein
MKSAPLSRLSLISQHIATWFCIIPVNLCVITCGCLQNEICASFKTLFDITAHSAMILLLLYTHQPEYEFGGSLTDVQIVFQNALNWYKWSLQHISNFIDRDSSESLEITNKMQPCNRIYYSKIYWRLNMFRGTHRSSSGAPNCICSLWFIYPCGDHVCPGWVGSHPALYLLIFVTGNNTKFVFLSKPSVCCVVWQI